jgi:hypothetical protein
MGVTHSGLGLVLCSIPLLVHGPEVYNPTLTRFVANLWFPPFTFNKPYTLSPEKAVNYEEQLEMFKAFLKAAPAGKMDSAKDLIFLMLFETRQGSAGFWAAALGAYYASTLPLEQRHPVHFVFLILSVLMTMADANHGLKFPFGNHPLISKNGWAVGIAFTPFWLLSAYCNYTAMMEGRAILGL